LEPGFWLAFPLNYAKFSHRLSGDLVFIFALTSPFFLLGPIFLLFSCTVLGETSGFLWCTHTSASPRLSSFSAVPSSLEFFALVSPVDNSCQSFSSFVFSLSSHPSEYSCSRFLGYFPTCTLSPYRGLTTPCTFGRRPPLKPMMATLVLPLVSRFSTVRRGLVSPQSFLKCDPP